MAFGVFNEQPGFTYLDDGYGGDDDGWDLADGAIPIPPDAPDGIYRIRERVFLLDSTGSSQSNFTIEARFMIGEIEAALTESADDDDAAAAEAAAAAAIGPVRDLVECEYDAFVDWIEEPMEGVNVFFDRTVYQPGDRAAVQWEVEDGLEVVVGDEWIIDCWTGELARPAWAAIGIFEDNPRFVLLDEDVAFTDDGFGAAPGVVVIPPDAPRGFYTAVIDVAIFETNGDRVGLFEFERSFQIDPR